MIVFVLISLLYTLSSFLYLRVAAIEHTLISTAVLAVLAGVLLFREFRKPVFIVLEKTQKPDESNKSLENTENTQVTQKSEQNGLRNRKAIVEKHDGFEVHHQDENKMIIKHYSADKPLLKLWALVYLVLLLFSIDQTFKPLFQTENNLTFTRLGHITHNTAKIAFRIHPSSFYQETKDYEDSRVIANEIILLKYAKIQYRGQKAYPKTLEWLKTETLSTLNQYSDYTGLYKLSNLDSSSLYYIQFLIKNNNKLLSELEFKTAPNPGEPTTLKFGSGSCIKPNFPYVPASAPSITGLRRMSKHNLDMVMFMGDFIYADSPHFFGPQIEDYRRLYRQVYAIDDTKNLVSNVPMLHIYDDHEITDNWDSKQSPPYNNAMKAYWEYNGLYNPDSPFPNALYYNFTFGDIAFYVWDTRGNRDSHKIEDSPQKTMLGQEQKNHFFQWLKHVNHTSAVKFVVSSVPLAYVWDCADAKEDTWGGYRYEREEILSYTKYVPNLFFLSGDRHETAVVRLSSDNIEFSTSPVNQFSLPYVNNHVSYSGGDITEYFIQPGQIKYGVIEVDTKTDPNIPKVKYNLFTNNEQDENTPNYVYEAECEEWK
ncbi:hypothetical protein BB561_004513 [Smittium simulii]|uniref:PhoD-like phosphatase metallophosphatase domain-containing protein n=1 Tax=Smittium simulii TaxID=133385 RepID=A0A2T9YFW6_9FUNG|nr:hypothetical protein BB561_004513 [Smittium simulii]